MSTLAEMVEEEAAAAEAEPDDENGEPEPAADDEDENGELDPEASGVPVVDPKALEREVRRHRTAMEKLLGEGWADMKGCETCGELGFVPEDFTPAPAVMHDPNATPCPDCNGYGLRETGSLREGNQVITCDPCAGAGWRDRRQIEALRTQDSYVAPSYGPPPPPQPVWNQATQQWETLEGSPIYAAPPSGLPATV